MLNFNNIFSIENIYSAVEKFIFFALVFIFTVVGSKEGVLFDESINETMYFGFSLAFSVIFYCILNSYKEYELDPKKLINVKEMEVAVYFLSMVLSLVIVMLVPSIKVYLPFFYVLFAMIIVFFINFFKQCIPCV